MHYIHLEKSVHNLLTVHVEGRLDNALIIEEELKEILQGVGNIKNIHINMQKVESISEECFKMFQRLQDKHSIKFEHYSLFVELQLIDHQLIPAPNKVDQFKTE